MHHDELLLQAKHLTSLPASTQADLRRAVSSGYYAVFHFFAHESTEHFLGGKAVTPETRQVFARSFSHGSMREACACFSGRESSRDTKRPPTPRPQVDRVAKVPRIGEVTIPYGIQAIADSFIKLIEARHQADYDLSASFTKSEADTLVLEAEQTLQAWSAYRSQPIGYLFLSGLLLFNSLRSAR